MTAVDPIAAVPQNEEAEDCIIGSHGVLWNGVSVVNAAEHTASRPGRQFLRT